MRTIVLFVAAVAAVGVVPRAARACGGFFCNGSAVVQSEEKILFAVEDDGTIVAHIQIGYSGSSPNFAWILPVPSVPDLDVGTAELFVALDEATAPRFEIDTRFEGECQEHTECTTSGGDPWISAGNPDEGSTTESRPAVELLHAEEVGPYDAVVISASDSLALRTWLNDEGFAIPAGADAAIDSYVAEGQVFVAIKLTKDSSWGDIVPLELRFSEAQPCIPLRITAIAVADEMPITAYVLGATRAASANYLNVPVALDLPSLWLSSAYPGLVESSIDLAGGRGFVTEYAGSPRIVRLRVPDLSELRELTHPSLFLRALQELGFAGDSRLLRILTPHIPPSPGWTPRDFYNCILRSGCTPNLDYLASLELDTRAIIDDLERELLDPRRRAQALIDRFPALTRMYTVMRPEHMTEDPVFVLTSDVPVVDNVHRAEIVIECSAQYTIAQAPRRLQVPGGAAVPLAPLFGGSSGSLNCADLGVGDGRSGMRRGSGDGAPYEPPWGLPPVDDPEPEPVSAGSGCSVASPGRSTTIPLLMLIGFCFFARRRS